MDPCRRPAVHWPMITATMALDAVIQRFQLLEVVGRGGMGVVYRAHDPQLLRDVAIKVLSTDCVPAPLWSHPTIDLRAAAPAVHDELIDEARVMAQLSHPNVLPVYEVGLDGDSVFWSWSTSPGRTCASGSPARPRWRPSSRRSRAAHPGIADPAHGAARHAGVHGARAVAR
jgi:eukaryotic-like serine/threonine-protein kinase